MATKKKLLEAAAGSAGGSAALNVEDVFSTYLWEGTSAARDITNGIDLDGEGGLVWIKWRSGSNAVGHQLYTEPEDFLASELTAALNTGNTTRLNAFNSDGFSLGNSTEVNYSGDEYASWTFRKAPKFFDVVTYTGDGTAGRTVSHNLDAEVGMMIIKKYNSTQHWFVYHRSLDATAPEDYRLKLNATSGIGAATTIYLNGVAPTSTTITLGSNDEVNGNGNNYVMYLFAHNDGDGEFGPDGDADIIKCGSYTGNGSSTGPTVDLGFEPQWILVKQSSASGQGWIIYDAMRGLTVAADDAYIAANDSGSELTSYQSIKPTSTGFQPEANHAWVNSSGATYIYIAIRRGPMAVPEDATDVFAIDTEGSSEPYFDSTFPVDFGLQKRHASSGSWYAMSRLTQGRTLKTETSSAEIAESSAYFDYMDGFVSAAAYGSGNSYGWMWRRAPNFFDIAAYEGNGTAGRTVSHNLGAVPEMMWVKRRSLSEDWMVYHSALGNTHNVRLNKTGDADTGGNPWNNTTPTDAVFTVGSSSQVNTSGETYIAYLFASLDGVSKVGSFTSTGSDVSVDCGFTNGARFVLLKRTNTTDDWWVWDTERGIVAGNDSRLKLNGTNAEALADNIDPYSSGFTITSGILGGSGNTFIYYAIA